MAIQGNLNPLERQQRDGKCLPNSVLILVEQLTALGLAPSSPLESGIYRSLPPGAFTAILAGQNGGTGVGLVEVYNGHDGGISSSRNWATM